MAHNPYELNLEKNIANYSPLSPLSFLKRAADVYPEYTSVVYGSVRYTWLQTRERCTRLGAALSKIGIEKNQTVAIMAPNIPAMYEAHFGVPLCGAVLNSINTRLDAATVAFILEHSEAKVLIADTEYSETVARAIEHLESPPVIIDIEDACVTDGLSLIHI